MKDKRKLSGERVMSSVLDFLGYKCPRGTPKRACTAGIWIYYYSEVVKEGKDTDQEASMIKFTRSGKINQKAHAKTKDDTLERIRWMEREA